MMFSGKFIPARSKKITFFTSKVFECFSLMMVKMVHLKML